MKKIYLDMDGVLVNLDKALIDHVGHSWILPSQEMWDLIRKKVPQLFLVADPFEGAHEFVRIIEGIAVKHGYEIEILTAVPSMVSFVDAPTQKQQWIREKFPILLPYKFNIGPFAVDKQRFAREGDILIDDSTMNISQWIRAGGIGINHVNQEISLTILTCYLKHQVLLLPNHF